MAIFVYKNAVPKQNLAPNLFKFGLNTYLHSSLHVAFTISAITLLSYYKLDKCINLIHVLLVFFASVVGYNFLKYQNDWRHQKTHQFYLIISVLAVGCAIWLWWMFFWWAKLILIFHVLLLVMYQKIRPLGWLKMFYVAMVISSLTTFFPMIDVSLGKLSTLNPQAWWLLVKNFLLILALLIPFEIAAVETDDLLSKTLPQRFGIHKIKWLGYVLISLFILISVVYFSVFSDIIMACLVFLFVYSSSPKRSMYYTSLWGDALPIIWLFLYLIEKRF